MRKNEIATSGCINKPKTFEAYGAGCESTYGTEQHTSATTVMSMKAATTITTGMSSLQTVAMTRSTKGCARKDGLARGAVGRNECWIPCFCSVGNYSFEAAGHAAMDGPSPPAPGPVLGKVVAPFPIALRWFEQLAIGEQPVKP